MSFEKETKTWKCNRVISILLEFYGSVAQKGYTGNDWEFDGSSMELGGIFWYLIKYSKLGHCRIFWRILSLGLIFRGFWSCVLFFGRDGLFKRQLRVLWGYMHVRMCVRNRATIQRVKNIIYICSLEYRYGSRYLYNALTAIKKNINLPNIY